MQEHQKAAPQRHLELSQAGDVRGEWDADRLAQAASNLIDNAVNHGGADHPVRVGLDGLETDSVALTVANSGVIPPELQPHIFDPFRGRDQHSARPGLGLGLFIARQIARAHQGDVLLMRSESGVTVFQLKIPRFGSRAP
jgi:signal transduction histidine kinase